MTSYATVGSNMIEKAREFYDSLLAELGMQKRFDHPSGGRIYGGENGGMFGVLRPHDEKDASIGNGTMIGFGAKDRGQVDAFHAKALELGGKCEGAPGERAGGPAYFAYVRDLDGNKLCAYTFNPPS